MVTVVVTGASAVPCETLTVLSEAEPKSTSVDEVPATGLVPGVPRFTKAPFVAETTIFPKV